MERTNGDEAVPQSTWKPEYTERAKAFWDEYQRANDLSELHGKTAAIDPESGRIWIGNDPVELYVTIRNEGFVRPVYLVRVGYDHFVRKGRH